MLSDWNNQTGRVLVFINRCTLQQALVDYSRAISLSVTMFGLSRHQSEKGLTWIHLKVNTCTYYVDNENKADL